MAMLDSEKRRQAIIDRLSSAHEAVTGQELSDVLGVSRQAIVQDIAVLRAHGKPIVATPRGYAFAATAEAVMHEVVVACRHDMDTVREELMVIVRAGAEVKDVVVEHPVYGQITGMLMLRNEEDVLRFEDKVRTTGAALLSSLTRGVHLHTLRASDARVLGRVVLELSRHGFLVDEKA
jgi:uncharacterized protein